MKYLERERIKAVNLRSTMFQDPGNGMFLGKAREFVLSNPKLNLWEGIREDTLDYFQRNRIVWWHGDNGMNTGHLLSSQVACVNHLFFLHHRKDLATAILQGIDSSIAEALVIDDGYVEFEFIGEKQYLKEKGFSRGANCTSVDAAMMGMTTTGHKKLFLIEWKYTESYKPQSKYIPERASVYDHLIQAQDSPFIMGVNPSVYYYEPFYQLMRQTILADQLLKFHDHDIDEYLHIHVAPEKNEELRTGMTSPGIVGKDIHEAWKRRLRDDSLFLAITPELLLEPAWRMPDTHSEGEYLRNRYWSK